MRIPATSSPQASNPDAQAGQMRALAERLDGWRTTIAAYAMPSRLSAFFDEALSQ